TGSRPAPGCLAEEPFQALVAVLAGGVDRAEVAAALRDAGVGAPLEEQLTELVAELGPLVLGRDGRVERVGPDVLVSREGVGIRAVVEQDACRIDVSVEAGEGEWLEPVVAVRVGALRVLCEELAQPLGVP